jgi:hypothetical protein
VRSVLVLLVGLIAATAFACESAEKDYAKYLYDQCDQFKEVLFEPQTENWSPTLSSLQRAYEGLQEIDKSLSEAKPPTERTRTLSGGLQLLVHGLEVATRESLNISPLSDSALYYRAAAGVIGDQLYGGDVYSGVVSLAMKLGAVTTTTGLGASTTTGH